ncbi:MAG TPA: hypothetical protein VFX61_22310, partial [Micromonosporaceae bacterium]|nr:hypothetical protein [Micromonosporaceae bacterium]
MSTSPPSEPHNPDPRPYPSETIELGTPTSDVLVSPAEEAAERPRRRQWPIFVAVATVVALLLGGAAFAGARLWYGSGAQPEEATPSTVVAFVRLDLSPGYGQRFAINNLIKKFPQKDSKDPIDELKRSIFELLDIEEAAYRKHVQPWFADRIGAGLWLDGKNQPYGLMTLGFDDEAKASAGLAELQRKKGEKKFGFVMREGFALVALGGEASQAAAEAAAEDANRETLADAGQFRRGLEWLPPRQTAVAWIDLAKYGAMMQAMMGNALDGMDEEFDGELPEDLDADIPEEFDGELPEDFDADMPFEWAGIAGGLFPGMGGLTQGDEAKGQLILGASAT